MNKKDDTALNILECPVCGLNEKDGLGLMYFDSNEHYAVHCANCGILWVQSSSVRKAVDAWNIMARQLQKETGQAC